ncbi:MAG: hypothetical protein Ct9H300mP27_07070 [Chloroflexota bacterium]|nr:MAG: hypothetical protein Ct9H300mP27_07070 [Chloroflexota bacterium]
MGDEAIYKGRQVFAGFMSSHKWGLTRRGLRGFTLYNQGFNLKEFKGLSLNLHKSSGYRLCMAFSGARTKGLSEIGAEIIETPDNLKSLAELARMLMQ